MGVFEKEFVATLRGHPASITEAAYFYVPSNTSYDNLGRETPLLVPTLISSDENGCIIWWDLNTRRPLYTWQAHTETILSINQLGLEWKISQLESDKFQYPIIKQKSGYGRLLTHGKDGEIKIWQLFALNDPDKPTAGFTYEIQLTKKISFDNVLPPLKFQLPVNVLNFSNVQLNSYNNRWIVTPATVDAQGWDLYELLDMETESTKFNRPIKNYRYPDGIKTGIIMKILWISETRLLVGYESGLVSIYGINKKDFTVELLFKNDLQAPNPITSIAVDDLHKKIICGSASDSLVIINIQFEKFTVSLDHIKHKGINYINCEPHSKTLALVTWDGYLRTYNYENELQFLFKIRKAIPSVENTENSITQRAILTKFSRLQYKPNSSKLIYQNGRSKNIIRRNRHELFNRQWFIIGYEDGRIGLYII